MLFSLFVCSWSAGASEVFMIYAKMTSPRWNEPVVMDWLIKNATELCKNYNKDQAVRVNKLESLFYTLTFSFIKKNIFS